MRRIGRVGRRRAAALKALMPALLARAGSRCETPWCRRRAKLDPHHHPKRSQGGTERLDTVVLLCRPCHNATDLPAGNGRLDIRVQQVDGRPIAIFVQGDLLQARPLLPDEKH